MLREDKFIKVYIGRFQPFHNGHLRVLRASIATSDRVIVVIGSAQKHVNDPKNPWTCWEREDMIKASLRPSERKKVAFFWQYDRPGQDDYWVKQVRDNVEYEAERVFPCDRHTFTLVGCHKGADTYYLGLYKGWKRELVPHSEHLNATDVRNDYFGRRSFDNTWAKNLPQAVVGYLLAWRRFHTKQFENEAAE